MRTFSKCHGVVYSERRVSDDVWKVGFSVETEGRGGKKTGFTCKPWTSLCTCVCLFVCVMSERTIHPSVLIRSGCCRRPSFMLLTSDHHHSPPSPPIGNPALPPTAHPIPWPVFKGLHGFTSNQDTHTHTRTFQMRIATHSCRYTRSLSNRPTWCKM